MNVIAKLRIWSWKNLMSNNFILRSFDFRLSYLCKSEHSLRSHLKRGCLKLLVSFNQEKIL